MYIAQVNIAKMKEPLDSVVMKEFFDFLDPINRLADESKGFIWRLTNEEGESFAHVTSPLEDDMIIINMSVWTDIESLKDYVYNTAHSYFVRSSKKWFHKMERQHMALWWVPENDTPTMNSAIEKLDLLDKFGPTPNAFNFKTIFEQPMA